MIEVYDREEKKAFIKELDAYSKRPASITKKKVEALRWNHRNQATAYAAKMLTDMYFGIYIPECMFSGFKVIRLR